VAGSIITVAGVVFSITIVALSLASSQFGPRLLRNFMCDTGNQVVLGTFIATFVYCLLVLRTVRGSDSAQFVPAIAITGGVVLAMASLGVLIYFIHFIHHVASSIQVTHLITVVNQDLLHAIARLSPDRLGCGRSEPQDWPDAHLPEGFEREARPVSAARSGYLQAIDSEGLMQLATEHDLIPRVTPRPAHFIIQGNVLATAWPGERVDEPLAEKIHNTFIVGAERVLPSPSRYDVDGRLRAVVHPVTFTGVTDVAFNQIRQYGRGSAPVMIRLLEAIAGVAARVSREEDRSALLQQARMIKHDSDEAIPEERDRNDIEAWYQAVERVLEQR